MLRREADATQITLQTQVDKLIAKSGELQLHKTKLEAELEALEDIKERIESEKETAETERDELRVDLDIAKQEIDVYQRRIKEQTQEISELKFEVKVKERDHEAELEYYKEMLNEKREQTRSDAKAKGLD